MNLIQLKSIIADKQAAGEDCVAEKETLALHMAGLRTDADVERRILDGKTLEGLWQDAQE